MTSLERLIKLASTDVAAHYRELAKLAKTELFERDFVLENCRSVVRQLSVEPTLDPKMVKCLRILDWQLNSPTIELRESPCTPTPPMSK